jgi:hypothetical protein
MKLLITGICGFMGLTAACGLQNERRADEPLTIFGVHNFSRPGSKSNRLMLKSGKIDSMPRRTFNRAAFS